MKQVRHQPKNWGGKSEGPGGLPQENFPEHTLQTLGKSGKHLSYYFDLFQYFLKSHHLKQHIFFGNSGHFCTIKIKTDKYITHLQYLQYKERKDMI